MIPKLIKKRKCRTGAFTLIELLVVMAVIGVLVSILLPAVQAARERGRRTSCTNNLKNLGLAVQGFHELRNHIPPARVLGPFKALKINAKAEHSWAVFILPYLEQQTLHDKYFFDRDFRDPMNAEAIASSLDVFICPTTPRRFPRLDTFTSGGFVDWRTAPSDYVPLIRVDEGLALAGFIRPVADYSGAMQSNEITTFADIQDGLSNTLLFAEAAGRPMLYRAGVLEPDIRVRGSGWADSRNAFSVHGSTEDGTFSPGKCAVNCTNDREIYSFHAEGANVVFADGSVRLLSEQLDIQEVCYLVTKNGRENSSDQP